MIVRGDSLAKSMSAYLVERIEQHPQIEVRLRSQVHGAARGGGPARGGDDRERRRRRETDRRSPSLFLCIGGIPRTQWAAGSGVRTDDAGFILTGPDLLENGHRPEGWPLDRDPLALETSVPGLFAAGDVRHGSTKRVAGAVGRGRDGRHARPPPPGRAPPRGLSAQLCRCYGVTEAGRSAPRLVAWKLPLSDSPQHCRRSPGALRSCGCRATNA